MRGGRSARATLTSRAASIAVLTAIVVFASADVLHQVAGFRPYGNAPPHAVDGETVRGEHGCCRAAPTRPDRVEVPVIPADSSGETQDGPRRVDRSRVQAAVGVHRDRCAAGAQDREVRL